MAMRSIKNRVLQAALAAALAAMVVMPVAIANASGAGVSKKSKSVAALQLKLLRQQSVRLTKFAIQVAEQVAELEERTAFLESLEGPDSLPPRGPAGGDLIGSYPNPVLGPNSVGSPELFNGAVGPLDIADEAVGSFDLAAGAVGSLEIQDGSISGPDLKGAEMVETNFLQGVLVEPGNTEAVSVRCPEGTRLLSGGWEWLRPRDNELSIVSSGPAGDDPERTWGVQARVDSLGGQNEIFAIAYCLKA